MISFIVCDRINDEIRHSKRFSIKSSVDIIKSKQFNNKQQVIGANLKLTMVISKV